MQILLTADDFGFDDDTVDTTIACLEGGTITNASIMANMAGSERALAYARSHPEFCFGVHLTFTRDTTEAPVAPVAEVAGLVGADGRFLPGRPAQLKALRGGFPSNQIRTELRAQLQRVADAGVPIDYVDSHKHLHKFPVFAKVLPEVLAEFGVTRVRRVQNRFEGPTLARPTVWLDRIWKERITTAFASTDHFFMADGTETNDWWNQVPLDLTGSLEVGTHPGATDAWRANERRGLDALAVRLRDRGIVPSSWRDISA